tara:strand:+ start:4625 stop:4792 length:168 start_codon:yes stop_codon:yes gene_type:complete
MFCCKECGSIKIESKAWIDPNTNEIIDDAGPFQSKDNNYCYDCQEPVALVYKEAE